MEREIWRKRESRRIIGDYILNENDIKEILEEVEDSRSVTEELSL